MFEECKTINLFEPGRSIASGYVLGFEYPWEALSGIGEFILKTGSLLDPKKFNQIGEDIWIAKDATVAPSVSITGPLIIDEGAEIRHCAFIRGNAIIGKGATVGNSVEIKNSILFDGAQTPHYNYVGDSIIGYKSHMGAGSITSNLKSDKTDIVIRYNGQTLKTGRRKIGAILGDNVEVGCNSVLNPGTIVGRGTRIYPVSMVRGVISAGSIYKKKGEIVGILEYNSVD